MRWKRSACRRPSLPARWLDTSPKMWLNLQAIHDLRTAEDEFGDAIREQVTPRGEAHMQFPCLWGKLCRACVESCNQVGLSRVFIDRKGYCSSVPFRFVFLLWSTRVLRSRAEGYLTTL